MTYWLCVNGLRKHAVRTIHHHFLEVIPQDLLRYGVHVGDDRVLQKLQTLRQAWVIGQTSQTSRKATSPFDPERETEVSTSSRARKSLALKETFGTRWRGPQTDGQSCQRHAQDKWPMISAADSVCRSCLAPARVKCDLTGTDITDLKQVNKRAAIQGKEKAEAGLTADVIPTVCAPCPTKRNADFFPILLADDMARCC
jgi:hypothetical protein